MNRFLARTFVKQNPNDLSVTVLNGLGERCHSSLICGAAVSDRDATLHDYGVAKLITKIANAPLISKSTCEPSFRSSVTFAASPSEQAFQRAETMIFRRAAHQEITEKWAG